MTGNKINNNQVHSGKRLDEIVRDSNNPSILESSVLESSSNSMSKYSQGVLKQKLAEPRYRTLKDLSPMINTKIGFHVGIDILYKICANKTYNIHPKTKKPLAIKNRATSHWRIEDSDVPLFIKSIEKYYVQNTNKQISQNKRERERPDFSFFNKTIHLLLLQYKENENKKDAGELEKENKLNYSIAEVAQLFNVPEQMVENLITKHVFLPSECYDLNVKKSVRGNDVVQLYSAITLISDMITKPEKSLLKEVIEKKLNNKCIAGEEECNNFVNFDKTISELRDKIYFSENMFEPKPVCENNEEDSFITYFSKVLQLRHT